MPLVRVVAFEDVGRSQKRFELCYAAILLGAPKGAPRGMDVLRREARLLDALDAISAPDPQAAPLADDVPRRLVMVPTSLALLQPDFDLLSKYLEAVAWAPIVARAVVDAADWLAAAPARDDP